ncbi:MULTISPECIES: cyclophilin-like fold protein [unclassified Streptomyces]|uniref:cyclophilin-like fold protein n=1 Tax=unclassified Streptomyces TaxID=2593676 RepID=UPI00225ABC5C|nr:MULTISPECIES: cyclophilin-like fold protein [unclassified Streptomyces]MCX4834283.1 cyclophilin-like fold protein [Streptomyces sp. NBC_01016]
MSAALCFTLASCTNDTNGQAAEPSSRTTTSSTSAVQGHATPIHIKIGDRTVSATVRDTPTGAALLKQLPRTLKFEDLNGAEKVAKLPKELPMKGMPEGDNPKVGDLGYYAPWGNLVLYYGDVDYWDGIARIGRIDSSDLAAISGQSGDFTATVAR